MKTIGQIIGGKKITVHLLFCIIVLVLFYAGAWSLYAAGFRLGDVPMVLARSLFFLLCIYTGRWLCQGWYLQNKWVLFVLFTMVCCSAIALSWWLVIKYIFGAIYAGFLEVVISVMPFFLIGVVAGMLLKLVSVTMQKQVQEAQAATEQKQSELNLLQSQLSPHFLFNTLNNLYGISIAQHERLPALLLKLSDLLRYSVYETKKSFVPLAEELAYINNYIEFEKIRISDRLLLKSDIEVAGSPGIMVAPMVLIVFIENAFKHAKNTLDQKIYIDISLTISGNFIVFSVKNSSGAVADKYHLRDESSGLGLVNTVKRLDLLYGSDYMLKQVAQNDVYTVDLRLKIK
ncbi:MAG TPA: histidine kinase [Chitinophagaceae bacterium]|nr:histidine kinase [Chitinophagaceae bacterium]